MYRSSLYRTQSAQEILHGSGIFANITGPCLLNVDKQFQHHGAANGHELIATIVCFTFLIVLNFCQIKFCKNILFWNSENEFGPWEMTIARVPFGCWELNLSSSVHKGHLHIPYHICKNTYICHNPIQVQVSSNSGGKKHPSNNRSPIWSGELVVLAASHSCPKYQL